MVDIYMFEKFDFLKSYFKLAQELRKRIMKIDLKLRK